MLASYNNVITNFTNIFVINLQLCVNFHGTRFSENLKFTCILIGTLR